MRTLIQNGRILTPSAIVKGGILFESGRIIAVLSPNDCANVVCDTIIDADGCYVSPGFIDIHTHGAGGHDFMDGTPEAFLAAARTHLRYGTTTLYPTTLTSTLPELQKTIAAFGQAKAAADCPHMPGLHLEGPYLAQSQRGAQDPKFIKDPDPDEYESLVATGEIARWTIAPELPGALTMARYLSERGIICSIGHSDAHYDQVVEAVAAGFSLCTHLYSGMSGVHRIDAHRYAGVVESAFLLDELAVEIIADGVHLPASLLKLIYKIKGPYAICLVTDSIRGTGTNEKTTIMGSLHGGQEVLIEEGVAKLLDRTAFAGSVCTADRLLRTMTHLAEVPLLEAVRMLTQTPARVMGLQHKGTIAPGMDADIVLFDDELVVQKVIVAGKTLVPNSEEKDRNR